MIQHPFQLFDLPDDQAAIRARCFHPQAPWYGFPRAALNQSIVARFEQMVSQFPNRLAVKQAARQLTYSELNGMANGIAHALLEQRGEGAEPIALLFEQGVDMIIALLGVLKTGKFYVPLSPQEPIARMHTMVADAQAKVLLTNHTNYPLAQTLAVAQRQANDQFQIIAIDDPSLTRSNANPNLAIELDAFAYLIYTSGSTGQPKGVIETHRNVLHFVMTHSHCEHYVPSDRCGLTRAYTFSGTASLLYCALLNGAALFPYTMTSDGGVGLASWLAAEEITMVSLAPSMLRQLAEKLPGVGHLPALRFVRLSGDRVVRRDIELYQHHFSPNCLAQLTLGTTEVKIIAHYFVDHASQFPDEILPVGYLEEDIEVLILDEAGNELGFDQIGEIAVRSRYVSPGYWRQPALTAARFLPVPADPAKRIYLTGDLGKLRSDGCLFHLGRNDGQVKILGQMVATIEVEAALLQLDAVQEAVVTAPTDPDGAARLVAYVVLQPSSQPTVTRLRKALADLLPVYMMPSAFVFLDALPLNANGKIDRRALPAPSAARPPLDQPFVAPHTPTEQTLAELWGALLGVEPIGMHDNFFELGGDSLSALRMIVGVEQQLGLSVPTRFLQVPTLANLVALLNTGESQEIDPLPSLKSNIEPAADDPAVWAAAFYTKGAGTHAKIRKQVLYRGPILKGRVLPYGLGVCIQRTWLRQRVVQNRLLHEPSDLFRRCCAEAGCNDAQAALLTLNLMANTWVTWRTQALQGPANFARWVTLGGSEQIAAAVNKGKGLIIVFTHQMFTTNLTMKLLRRHGIQDVPVITGNKLTPGGSRVASRTQSVRDGLALLRRGGAILIAGEGRDATNPRHVPFYGRQLPMPRGFTELALHSQATVAAVFSTLSADGHLSLDLVALPTPTSAIEATDLLTQYTHLLVERWPQLLPTMHWGRLKYLTSLPATLADDRQRS